MPNWVPQSPTWFTRRTSWPQNSRTRQIVSPMIVDRRWPTCISLAMFGDEKSTSTFRAPPNADRGGGAATPDAATRCAWALSSDSSTWALMKPAGATLADLRTPFAGTAAAMASPTARGDGSRATPFALSVLKMPMGALHW